MGRDEISVFSKALEELGCDFGPHFKVLEGNAGTYRGVNVRSTQRLHRPNRSGEDSGNHASPSGVDCPDDAAIGGAQQNRGAIGDSHCDET